MSAKQWLGVLAVGVVATAGLAALGTRWVHEPVETVANAVPTLATVTTTVTSVAPQNTSSPATSSPSTPAQSTSTGPTSTTSATKSGEHHVVYLVSGGDGSHLTTVTWTDPVTGESDSVATHSLPWTRSFDTDRNVRLRLHVDNTKGSTSVHCTITEEGRTVSAHLIHAAHTGTCTG